jgi:predicted CoA-binding protein
MPLTSDQIISRALRSKTIAVVGLSRNPEKASNDVASYLKLHGYRIVPINPTAGEVLGEECYASLHDVPDELKREIEVLDVFRRPEDVPPVVEEAIQLRKAFPHLTTVWMQLGIVNEDAAERARKAGLNVIMDRCMKIEHGRRLGR